MLIIIIIIFLIKLLRTRNKLRPEDGNGGERKRERNGEKTRRQKNHTKSLNSSSKVSLLKKGFKLIFFPNLFNFIRIYTNTPIFFQSVHSYTYRYSHLYLYFHHSNFRRSFNFWTVAASIGARSRINRTRLYWSDQSII